MFSITQKRDVARRAGNKIILHVIATLPVC